MEVTTFTCDLPNCDLPASHFYWRSGIKTKVCASHPSFTLAPLFPITAFQYMNRADDWAAFQQDSELVALGLTHIDFLEKDYTNLLNSAKNRIENTHFALISVVNRCFQEIQRQAQSHYHTILTELQQSKCNLQRLLQDKDFKLNAFDRKLCTEMKKSRKFEVIIGDCRVKVAEIVLDNWVLVSHETDLERTAQEQVDKGRMDIAEAVNPTANPTKIQPNAYKYRVNLIKTLMKWLPVVQEDIEEITKLKMKVASEARELGYYVKARKKLEGWKRRLEQWGVISPELCWNLGLVWGHFGLRSDAASLLRQGLEHQLRLSPSSHLALRLNNAIASLCFQMGDWRDAISASEWTLRTYYESGYTFELWEALCYLVYSQCILEIPFEMNIEKWRLTVENPLCECLSFFLMGFKSHNDDIEAVGLLSAGLALAQQHIPHHYLTASAMLRVGAIKDSSLKKSDEAEQHYLSVLAIYKAHYPVSLDYVKCLYNLGLLYRRTNKLTESEPYYLRAIELFTHHHSTSIHFPQCLNNLAGLHKAMNRHADSESAYTKACDLLSTYHPDTLDQARCLRNFGLFYKSLYRYEESEEKLLFSCLICMKHREKPMELVKSLYMIGDLYVVLNRETALGAFEHALQRTGSDVEWRDHCKTAIRELYR